MFTKAALDFLNDNDKGVRFYKPIEDMTLSEIKKELEEFREPKQILLRGYKVEDLIEIIELIRETKWTRKEFEKNLKDFNKAFTMGHEECEKIYRKLLQGSTITKSVERYKQ
jgi:glutamyl/glutaminyl-tRNA synthetase